MECGGVVSGRPGHEPPDVNLGDSVGLVGFPAIKKLRLPDRAFAIGDENMLLGNICSRGCCWQILTAEAAVRWIILLHTAGREFDILVDE